jgi:uroporphyrinogen-III synthase
VRAVITRPTPESEAWLAGLRAAGHEALALPLIEISAVKDPKPVLAAWQSVSAYQAIMFVSAAAVTHFFSVVRGMHIAQHLGQTRCWATGPGTRKRLLAAGVPDALIDAPSAESGQFDSEALWQLVAPHVVPTRPVLIVRGTDANPSAETDEPAKPSMSAQPSELEQPAPATTQLQGVGRDWLANTLHNAGVPVHWVVSYQRAAPQWHAAQRQQALQASSDGSVWCFSSSQAIVFLQTLLPQHHWSAVRCIVTHERIAEAARRVGFGQVVVSRPVLAEVVSSLESMA